MSTFVPKGFGWLPDLPDGRDYTLRHPTVTALLSRLHPGSDARLPDEVDLRIDGDGVYFTDVDDQGTLNASSAFAALALVEYFERRVFARTFDGSKLFLYQSTRHRLAPEQTPPTDSGADLRSTLKVLKQVGVSPESYWRYEIDRFTSEPSPFVFANSKPLTNLFYLRLDESNSTGDVTWQTIKSFLASGFPVAFGFSVPSSLTGHSEVPYRPDLDAPRGGQAVVAVGYRANRYGPNEDAVLIRSSWGSQWGDNGNGWLPVHYIRGQIARDFWTLLSPDWENDCGLTRPAVV